ncbi:phospho-acceptor domain-containing protein [Rhizobium sp. BK251]|nr:phospho-acceptor domain-containing protein [Rhizobium sp. BK251]
MDFIAAMSRGHRSLFRSVPFILTAGAIILLGIVLGALYFTTQAARESEAAVRASRLNLRVLKLLSAVQDAETGQRGYLITGEERYLKPFEESVSTISSEAKSMAPALVDIGVQKTTIDELEELLTKKLDEMTRTIALQKQGDTTGATELVRSNLGINYMDRIRQIVDDIQQRGISESARHVSALRASTTWLSTFISFSAALLVLLSAGAIKLSLDRTREIDKARRELAFANETLEERVTERTRSLQQANNELQSYAYIVGHDLRAPLVNIVGFTEELERAGNIFKEYLRRTEDSAASTDRRAATEAVESDIPEALGFIRSSTQRMDNLINQILLVARAGKRELLSQPVRIRSVVDDALATLKHGLDETGISVKIGEPLPEVLSDRLALQQIISNLLDNAVKYMDPAREGEISVRGWRNGGRVVLEIKDNGRGIAEEDLERIFELFRRSGRQDRSGDGVGLAHVRTLARRLGGDVEVHSVLGEGTAFQIAIAADLSQFKREEVV